MAEHDAQGKKLLTTVLKADIVNQTCLSTLDVIVFQICYYNVGEHF